MQPNPTTHRPVSDPAGLCGVPKAPGSRPAPAPQTAAAPTLGAGALRDCGPARPGRPTARDRWWPWLLASAALHGLAAAALVFCAVVAGPAPEPPLTVIGHIDLGGLGDGAPAGGDGLAGGLDGAARETAATLPAEAAAPDPETVARAEPGPPVEPTPVPEPLAAPAPAPTPRTPPPRPRAVPKARPKTAAARPQPPGPPPAQPGAAEADHVSATGTGSGARAGDGSGRGLAGEGPGKGPTPGAGPGGSGEGRGDGRGEGGLSVDEFGRGDGPRFRHRSPLRYPDGAKRAGQEGKVRLRLDIDAEGVLRNVSVLEHTGLEFVEEALRAIKASTYYPAMRQGRPEACHALLTIRFAQG